MTALNKQALREAAEKALPAVKRLLMMPNDELFYEALLNVDGDVDAANAFNLIAGPETVLALLDELEDAERQNGYLREQRDEWERKAIRNFEECAEMSARIEELEAQRKLAFTVSNRWADKFREAEKRIAEHNFENRLLANADRDIKALRLRIAELEARTVTLPPQAPENLASVLDGYEKWLIATTVRDTWNACLAEVTRMNAAGIVLKGE